MLEKLRPFISQMWLFMTYYQHAGFEISIFSIERIFGFIKISMFISALRMSIPALCKISDLPTSFCTDTSLIEGV